MWNCRVIRVGPEVGNRGRRRPRRHILRRANATIAILLLGFATLAFIAIQVRVGALNAGLKGRIGGVIAVDHSRSARPSIPGR